jgi:hypothetical protein
MSSASTATLLSTPEQDHHNNEFHRTSHDSFEAVDAPARENQFVFNNPVESHTEFGVLRLTLFHQGFLRDG